MNRIKIKRNTRIDNLPMDGMEGLSQAEQESLRGGGDYYNRYTNQYVGSDGINDNRVYETINNDLSGLHTFVGLSESVEMHYDGALTGSGQGTSNGILRLIQNCSNGKQYTRLSASAVSGSPFSLSPIHRGTYQVTNPHLAPGAYVPEVGYGFDLVPESETVGITLQLQSVLDESSYQWGLGFHGTEQTVQEIYNYINQYIDYHGSMRAVVNVE